MSADYDGDRAQFFKKEAFQAFRLMDDRSPDYYISYKTQHDDQDRNLSRLQPFCANRPTEVGEDILLKHDADDEDINDLEHRLHVSLIFLCSNVSHKSPIFNSILLRNSPSITTLIDESYESSRNCDSKFSQTLIK